MHFLRKDKHGSITVAGMTEVIILVIVLVLVVSALMTNLKSSLTSYSKNETTFGPVLLIIVPILVGVAILLAVVRELLRK